MTGGEGGRRAAAQLVIGDRVRVDGVPQVVIGVSGTGVRLAGEDGTVVAATVTGLLAEGRVDLDGAGAGLGDVPRREVGLEGLPEAVVEAAQWWERHIAEVVYGLPPDAPPGTRPKPQYDPALHSLTARETAKAGELAAAGHRVSASTLKHRRQRWEAIGLAGLVDHRAVTRAAPFGRADPQVVAAMRQAIAEAAEESSKTAAFVIWRTGQILAASDSTAVLPPQRTSYRLFAALSRGKHTTGSASTRRSLAGRPEGMFGQVHACGAG